MKNMVKFTSFMCEHTAEYILVPQLVEAFSRRFAHTAPFFFWRTREGSSTSMACASNERGQLVSVYARRPKIKSPEGSEIHVKFNRELLKYAQESNRHGVPVFAGLPLVSRVQDIMLGTKCIWFRLHGVGNLPVDVEASVDRSGILLTDGLDESQIEGPLSADQIVRDACEVAWSVSWEDAAEHLRTISRDAHLRSGYGILGGYKPFHIFFRH